MYLDRSKSIANGKTYHRVLLRDSFRDELGKVKHHTIANLSSCSQEEIAAIELALKNKKNLASLWENLSDPFHLRQGKSFGAIHLLHQQAIKLGLVDSLGTDRFGQLALWQVIARALNQGSRLGAVRLANEHAIAEILDIEPFNEDNLYANLAELSQRQIQIEDALFAKLHPSASPSLFLYDVTSSYLEGQCNALSDWGYNRDGKKGKKQIVIGLLCDAQGNALSIEVFKGNTTDTKTFVPQVKKVVERFGGKSVTFVGDRGMIKSPQIAALQQEHFHYITAITKPQIEKLLENNILQIELFDSPLVEIQDAETNVRYCLRRNPQRQQEIEQTRQSQIQCVETLVAQKNQYLKDHPKAKTQTALNAVKDRIRRFKASEWLSVSLQDRSLQLTQDAQELAQASRLDGCYVIKTDLPKEEATAQVVHDRYKDLSLVEQNFRTMKTVELEMRPFYVRLESSTRGLALVVMLAHRLVKSLEGPWSQENLTVEEGLKALASLCLTEVVIKGQVKDILCPEPRASVKRLLDLVQVPLPKKLRRKDITVATKQKLSEHRPRRSK